LSHRLHHTKLLAIGPSIATQSRLRHQLRRQQAHLWSLAPAPPETNIFHNPQGSQPACDRTEPLVLTDQLVLTSKLQAQLMGQQHIYLHNSSSAERTQSGGPRPTIHTTRAINWHASRHTSRRLKESPHHTSRRFKESPHHTGASHPQSSQLWTHTASQRLTRVNMTAQAIIIRSSQLWTSSPLPTIQRVAAQHDGASHH